MTKRLELTEQELSLLWHGLSVAMKAIVEQLGVQSQPRTVRADMSALHDNLLALRRKIGAAQSGVTV